MRLNKKGDSQTEISLWLDSYEDIFSDFDPRSYEQKALSYDFLEELKRASRDKDPLIALTLLIPKGKRNLHQEKTIKKRLKEHFHKHFNQFKKERWDIIKHGLIFVIIGVILMFIASVFLFTYKKTFFISFLIILLEPAGWFLFWEGLNQIVFDSKVKKPDLIFYEKMFRCKVYFMNY